MPILKVLFPAVLAAASISAVSAQEAPTSLVMAQVVAPASSTTPPMAKPSVDHVAARIAELHTKLRITPDEEMLWNDVAQVMHDNEEKMRVAIEARATNAKTMTAIEDLKSYETITDEHAEGLKRLIPAFEALYDKMPPAQQKLADHVFDDHAKRVARTN